MAIAKIVHLSVVGGLSRDDLEGPTPGPSGVELQLDRAPRRLAKCKANGYGPCGK